MKNWVLYIPIVGILYVLFKEKLLVSEIDYYMSALVQAFSIFGLVLIFLAKNEGGGLICLGFGLICAGVGLILRK